MKEILIFEIYGDFGCFKKFYTTSSILTYDFPPKTCLLGLIGAILGYKRNSEDMKKLYSMKLGIQLLNPAKKVHQGINWLNTKVKGSIDNENVIQYFKDIMKYFPKNFYGFIGINEHKPSNIQLIKDPSYRIFLSNENIEESYLKLKEALIQQCYVYTPYLGQSEFLCSIKYIDTLEVSELLKEDDSEKVEISSIIPQDLLQKKDDNFQIEINSKTSIIVEQMPESYQNGATKFKKLIYEKKGGHIMVNVKSYYQIETEKIKNSPINVLLF